MCACFFGGTVWLVQRAGMTGTGNAMWELKTKLLLLPLLLLWLLLLRQIDDNEI